VQQLLDSVKGTTTQHPPNVAAEDNCEWFSLHLDFEVEETPANNSPRVITQLPTPTTALPGCITQPAKY